MRPKMATKSNLLRVQDVRDAYRLIGDCRDVGSDPVIWFPHMLDGLRKMFGAFTATGGEAWRSRSRGRIEAISAFQAGLTGEDYERYVALFRRGGPSSDPLFDSLQRARAPLVTRTRRQAVPDAAWYRSNLFNENFKPTGIDHRLAGLAEVANGGSVVAINLDRAAGDRDFSQREQRLLHFFHGELSRLVGRSLASATEPSPSTLSPRLRETLACLLQGDSEKLVAARLGLCPATVHQYVTSLYRRFGVQSRAQLMVHATRRSAVDARWNAADGAGASMKD